MSETDILIVRHPETEANVSGHFIGRGSSPFTATGRLQARRLPPKIAAFEPQVVWASPLERAHVVAIRAAELAHAPLVVDRRLVELDFGEAEGLSVAEIAEAGIEFNYHSRTEPVAPGGESRGQIEARSAAVADELVAEGGRYAIVTHGGVFRAMLVHLLGLASTDIWSFHIHNAQMAFVHVVDGHGMLEEFRQG